MFRKSNLDRLADRQEQEGRGPNYLDQAGPVTRFIRDRGVRETFESILVAIVLAMLFRNFLGEAYVIPTGSMATTLQGRHIDVRCEKCEYQYRTGASENQSPAVEHRVVGTECPICRYPMRLQPGRYRNHRPFSGDRILVNKFIYDFQTPGRWDVIVFKYPNNGKQNYIKRCVGLPGEALLIENGDIFTHDLQGETFVDRKIARKDPRKLLAMLQLVDDTNYIADQLIEADWPARWQQWNSTEPTWQFEFLDEGVSYENSGLSEGTQWLQYRHLAPRYSEWEQIESGNLPQRIREGDLGGLITDYYCYNEMITNVIDPRGVAQVNELGVYGLHWVGDLGVECEVDIESDTGQVALKVVEGGVDFICTIDVATGRAELTTRNPFTQYEEAAIDFLRDGKWQRVTPTAETPIDGAGEYQLRFVNADDRLYLWVNGQPIEFDASAYRRSDPVLPRWSPGHAGDAEPLGVGTRGAAMEISRLKVLRDIYYTSVKSGQPERSIAMEYDRNEITPPLAEFDPDFASQINGARGLQGAPNLIAVYSRPIKRILNSPDLWDSEVSLKLFSSRQRSSDDVFRLERFPDNPEKDQFLPMGDNSPRSNDGRVWGGQGNYVARSYLLGRAMFIYWPHAKTKPVPFTPNFERMRLIR